MPKLIILILLLGSYDSITKKYLIKIRDDIAKNYPGQVYGFMLENIDLFSAESSYRIIVEHIPDERCAIFVFKEGELVEVYDIEKTQKIEKSVYDLMKERYNASYIKKETVLTTINDLMQVAKRIFIIRDKEETRCGEYLELAHALMIKQSEKIYLFRQKDIELSQMLYEYLESFRVITRTYSDYCELRTIILRIIRQIVNAVYPS